MVGAGAPGGLGRRRVPFLNPINSKEIFVYTEKQLDAALSNYYQKFLENAFQNPINNLKFSLVIKFADSFKLTKPIKIGAPNIIFDGLLVPIYPGVDGAPVFETDTRTIDIYNVHIKNMYLVQSRDINGVKATFGPLLDVVRRCYDFKIEDNHIIGRSFIRALDGNEGLDFSLIKGNTAALGFSVTPDNLIEIDYGEENRFVHNTFGMGTDLIIRDGTRNIIMGNHFSLGDVILTGTSFNTLVGNTRIGTYTAGTSDQAGLNS